MASLVLSILIGSSSYLPIRWTIIKARISLNFVNIPSLIMELAVLEDSVVTTLTHLLFILAGNKDNHKIADGV